MHPYFKKIYVWCSPKDVPGQNFISNGQSNVTSLLLKSEIVKFKIFKPKINNIIFSSLNLYLNLIIDKRPIYIVSSRSIIGFLRDLPALMAVFFNIKVYCHIHGSDLNLLLNKKLIGNLAIILYRKVFKLIVPTEYALKNIFNLENINNQKVIVANPVFFTNKQLKNIKQKKHNKEPIILWNSNLIASKGLFNSLDAMLYVKEINNLKFRFKILGRAFDDNEMRKVQVIQKLETYLKNPWIKYQGPQSFEKAQDFIFKSDIVILPSRYVSECQPLALIYAMQLGKIIITSSHPSIIETLGNYPAYLIKDTNSIIEIADNLVLAIKQINSLEKIDIKFIKEAKTRFSLSRFLYKMQKVLI